MPELGITGLLILIATFTASYQGFKEPVYLYQYAFRVSAIRYGHQYYRRLTSGFLHTGWWHLLLNLLTLYCFSSGVEHLVDYRNLLLIYGASLVGAICFRCFCTAPTAIIAP